MSKAKTPNRKGTLYFLATLGTQPEYFKIGYTKDFQKRLATIEYSLPFEIVVVATAEGTRQDELKIHQRLRSFRLRGEWYSLPNKIQWTVLESFGRKVLPLEAFAAKGMEDACYFRYRIRRPDETLNPFAIGAK